MTTGTGTDHGSFAAVMAEAVIDHHGPRAHEVLGYSSWDAYCRAELDSDRVKIPRGDRGDVVGQLRDAGLSVRPIASATGTSRSAVQRELPGDPDGSPDEEGARDVAPVVGVDGKRYPPTPAPVPASPAPTAPRRRPLPDQARTAGWELRKAVERVERIAADDRLAANRDRVAGHLGSHLDYAHEAIGELRASLGGNEGDR